MDGSGRTTTTASTGPATGVPVPAAPPDPVVVAFDGSVPSRDAAHWAARELAGSGRPLRLLHALHWPRRELAELALPPAALDVDRARQAATAAVGLAVDRCRQEAPGADVEGRVVVGDAIELLRGRRGRGPARPGSLRPDRHSAGPARIQRRRTAPHRRDPGGRRPRPPDGRFGNGGHRGRRVSCLRSGSSLRIRLGSTAGHDVAAVHTWSDIPLAALSGSVDLDRDELAERAAAFLAARIEEAERRHRSVRVHVVTAADHPARALLGQASSAALMVVGRHGRAHSGAPLGSVCHAVAHYARCPVAVVGTG